MNDLRTAEALWRRAGELESAGRCDPVVAGSTGQGIINPKLREAQRLRNQARSIEGLSVSGGTPVCAAFAAASDLVGFAEACESFAAITPLEPNSSGALAPNPLLRHAKQLRTYVRQVATRPVGRCDQCGERFPQARRGRPRRFCSIPCHSKWHQARRPSERQSGSRPCVFCGYTFLAGNAGHRFCSTTCSLTARVIDRGETYAAEEFTTFVWLRCEDCGQWWPGRFAQRTRCDPCRASHRRAVKSLRGAYRRGAPKATAELVTLAEITDRCGGRCGLCGDPVLPFVRFPHPRSASIDHIVPVSKGGEHVPDNLQLAHFGCNSAKRDRAPCLSAAA